MFKAGSSICTLLLYMPFMRLVCFVCMGAMLMNAVAYAVPLRRAVALSHGSVATRKWLAIALSAQRRVPNWSSSLWQA